MNKGSLYCPLPYLNGDETVTCINLFQNGAERELNGELVRQLIIEHNQSDMNINDDDL